MTVMEVKRLLYHNGKYKIISDLCVSHTRTAHYSLSQRRTRSYRLSTTPIGQKLHVPGYLHRESRFVLWQAPQRQRSKGLPPCHHPSRCSLRNNSPPHGRRFPLCSTHQMRLWLQRTLYTLTASLHEHWAIGLVWGETMGGRVLFYAIKI